MKIRILGKAEKAGFYRFCYVLPGTDKNWIDQVGGGNNAYEANGSEVPEGIVVESEITVSGRLFFWNAGGTA